MGTEIANEAISGPLGRTVDITRRDVVRVVVPGSI